MKKLFTLFAFLTLALGANAVEIVDLETDYSTVTSWNGGWRSDAAAERVSIQDGCIYFHSTEATENFYDVQFQAFGIPNFSSGDDTSYTITIKIKGTVAQDLRASFSGSNTPGTIPVTTDWQEVVLEGCQNDPNAAYFANSGQLLIQCGDYVGDWWISYVKITHEGKEERPVTWQEWLTDDGQPIIPGVGHKNKWMGDAEFGQWPDWSLETDADGVNINWRGNRTGEICAWSIVRGKNTDPSQEPDPVKDPDGNVIPEGKPRPFPCEIEEVPAEGIQEGGHAFVVHTTAADNQYADWQSWDNQFFIQSPRSWKAGSQVRVKFKYKAEKPATAQTQIHRQNPSHYLFYQGIGDVSFTTEWQEYDYTLTFSDSQATGWSVAFNLNVDNKEPNTFYFDDLSWETMVLDEGLFVASSNTTTGIEYDFDNAVAFVAEEDLMVATVGTAGKKDTWVNEVMISTVRGNDRAYKGATIKPSGAIVNDPDTWLDYTDGSNAKIKFPAAGVWKISIDTEGKQINFVKIEGDKEKEPLDIKANTTEVIVKGQERDDLKDDEHPDATGQPWDNQFFIVANRTLSAGETTVIEFDYVGSIEAKTTTQCHVAPGAYVHWSAIGDVTFTTEEQHFSKTFTIPAEAEGMQSIAFNMAEIKEACDYTIKNFIWKLEDNTETLINMTGADNFYVKEGAGDTPHVFGTTAIQSIVTNSAASDAIYNLSGQRVSKSYKGIVVMDGKKYLIK